MRTLKYSAGKLRFLILSLFALAMVACTPSMRQEKSTGSIAWFDLVTESPDVARNFYSDVFDWRFSKGSTEGVTQVSANGEFIGSLISFAGKSPRVESQWIPVLSVEETLASVQIAKKAGGRLISQPIKTPEGTFASIEDVSGATLTLYDGSAGIPLDGAAKANTLVWADLFTNNVSAGKRFYGTLAGFETRRETASGSDFLVFTKGGADRGGLVRVSGSRIEPNWLPYILVSDLEKTISKATGNGASVLAREGGTAILLDPVGAAIGVTTREGASQ